MIAIHLSHPYYGCPRMKIALQEEGIYLNHKRVYRLMKNLDIQSVIRKKRRYFGQSGSVLFPNRLNRQFEAKGPGQIFVTDITYVSAGDRFYYLSAVQDLFNNEVVAWSLSRRNDVALVMDTLSELAIKKDVYGAVIHSDQGFQYTSKRYNKRIEEYGMKGSHSRKGNCLDNACIESFFSHLKTEKLYLHQCKTEQELDQAIQDYMYYYNYQRFQKKLNQRAPIEYRSALAA